MPGCGPRPRWTAMGSRPVSPFWMISLSKRRGVDSGFSTPNCTDCAASFCSVKRDGSGTSVCGIHRYRSPSTGENLRAAHDLVPCQALLRNAPTSGSPRAASSGLGWVQRRTGISRSRRIFAPACVARPDIEGGRVKDDVANWLRPRATSFGTNLPLCSVVLFAAGSQGSLGRF